MPDGGFDPKVLEEVSREVKSLGDNTKKTLDSMQRDLEAVRKLAEDAKSAADPLVKQEIEKLSQSVLAKVEEAEKAAKAAQKSTEEVELKIGRAALGAGGTSGSNQADEFKAAVEFTKARMASMGQLKADTVIDEKSVDMEGYRAWSASFKTYLRAKDERAVEAKALSAGSDPDGGYFVPPTPSARLQTIVHETSPMRDLATIETIGTDSLEIYIDEDEADCGWVGETETRATTNTPEVGVQKIPVHEIYAKPKATQKLLEDASVDIESWLMRKLGEKFGRTEATGFISGNGVKKPRGILTYPSGTSRGQIEQIASGAATALTFDGLIRTTGSLKEYYHANASWLMRRATEVEVLILKDGQGQYLWRPSLEAGKPSTLLGYAVRHAADMAALGAGSLSVAFGDFRAGYTVVERLGISVLRDPYSAKPFVEFYGRRRVGGDVVNFEAIKLVVTSAS